MTDLLSPIGEVETRDVGLAPRVGDLNGKVLGLLDNDMLGSAALLKQVVQRLSERFRFASIEVERRFGNPAQQAGEKLSERADFVVAALGC
ncbi:MAG: hypothetical protein HYX92_01360 [Chloroflexi bacterium]|nr:hypothetical protein [Chloroflexota bacterium]